MMPQARVLYDFAGSTPSELNLKKGELIEVQNVDTSESWWYGHRLARLPHEFGYFPKEYVRLVGVDTTKLPSANAGNVAHQRPPRVSTHRSVATGSQKNIQPSASRFMGLDKNQSAGEGARNVAPVNNTRHNPELPRNGLESCATVEQHRMFPHGLGNVQQHSIDPPFGPDKNQFSNFKEAVIARPPRKNVPQQANPVELRPGQQQVSKVLSELVQSETKYLGFLTVLHEKLFSCLEPRDTDWKRAVLSDPYVAVLATYIEQLLLVGRQFLAELNRCIQVQDYSNSGRTTVSSLKAVAQLLYEFATMFRLYAQYAAIQHKAMQQLSFLEEFWPLFRDLVQSLPNTPEAKGQTLASLLIMPIQRVPRYELFAKELSKYMKCSKDQSLNQSGVLQNQVSKAVEVVQGANIHVNNVVKMQTQRDELASLQAMFLNPVNLVGGALIGRYLVKQQDLLCSIASELHVENIAVFLLSDVIIFAERVGQAVQNGSSQPNKRFSIGKRLSASHQDARLKLRKILDLEAIIVSEATNPATTQVREDIVLPHIQCSFVIQSHEHGTISCYASDVQQRDDWVKCIEATQANAAQTKNTRLNGNNSDMSISNHATYIVPPPDTPSCAQVDAIWRVYESERRYTCELQVIVSVFVSRVQLLISGASLDDVFPTRPASTRPSSSSRFRDSRSVRSRLSLGHHVSPLQHLSGSFKSKQSKLSVVLARSADVMVALACLEQLEVLHQGVLLRLRDILTQDQALNGDQINISKLSSVFRTLAPLLVLYKSYRSRYDTLWSTLNLPEMADFIVRCERDTRCRGRPASDLLSVPLTRIQVYEKLLTKVLQTTFGNYQDVTELKSTIAAVQASLREVELDEASHSSRNVLVRIQESLIGSVKEPSDFLPVNPTTGVHFSVTNGVPNIVSDKRVLRYAGPVTFVHPDSLGNEMMWVFNDCLVVATIRKKESYQFQFVVWNSMVTLQPQWDTSLECGSSESTLQRRIDNPYFDYNPVAVLMRTEKLSFVMLFTTVDEKQKFLNECGRGGCRIDWSSNLRADNSNTSFAPVLMPRLSRNSCAICDRKFRLFRSWKHCGKCGTIACKNCFVPSTLSKEVSVGNQTTLSSSAPVSLCKLCTKQP